MSLKITQKKPVQIFVVSVIVSMTGIYWLCDYYLNSVGHELMLNWVRTESVLIQEGNLLTSSTKNQRFLFSSDYVQAVKLVKVDKNQIRERLHFGDPFSIEADGIPEMHQEIIMKRVGFLHSRAFYKIPGRDEMYLIFDIESKVLNSVFFGGVAFLLLMLIALVGVIRAVENQEYIKREEIFKHALNDFISKDHPSEIVERALPTLMSWWKDKKNQVEAAHQLAIQNQSKIMLGEIASRVGHDIISSVRNIEILSRRATGLNEKQTQHFNESLLKIKSIAADISKHTKKAIDEENEAKLQKAPTDLVQLLKTIVQQKQIQFEGQVTVELSLLDERAEVNLNSLEFERSISNLINNAAEASAPGAKIIVDLKSVKAFYQISIQDFGVGISLDNLKKIGTKGFSFGKENGTGIGVFYAKRFVEDLEGELNIESKMGQGTTVNILIPKLQSEVPQQIVLSMGQYLLILEDQKLMRDTVKWKLDALKIQDLNYAIFSTPSELEQWLATHNEDFKLYSDFYLETETGEQFETGTQVIKRLGLSQKSTLFTSAHDEPSVIQAASKIGVNVLSKDQFFDAEVRMM